MEEGRGSNRSEPALLPRNPVQGRVPRRPGDEGTDRDGDRASRAEGRSPDEHSGGPIRTCDSSDMGKLPAGQSTTSCTGEAGGLV